MNSDDAERADNQEFINRHLNLERIGDNALHPIISPAGIGLPAGFDREALRYELQSIVQLQAIIGRSKIRPSDRKKHAEKIVNSARKLRSELAKEELGWWFMNAATFPKLKDAQHAFTAFLARVIEAAELMASPPLAVSDDDDTGLGGKSAIIAAHIVPIFEKHFGQEVP